MNSQQQLQLLWQQNTAPIAPNAALLAEALDNTAFRHTLDALSDAHMQTVVMSISAADGGIKREVHPTSSQLISIVDGSGWLLIGDGSGASRALNLHAGITALVTAGTVHEVVRSDLNGNHDLKLFTIYTPPLHSGVSKEVARRADDIED